eukprot:TRINITY_DN4249_c0_g1_i2.p1 TRINITY_DN4249_c0_g1~~TRINITY_DN4249_c0_g1_i2.p1  ORF type:complete len:296 (+),score=18.98 TRINITY_DN4249_c0_g1_i2:1005-1892(+)
MKDISGTTIVCILMIKTMESDQYVTYVSDLVQRVVPLVSTMNRSVLVALCRRISLLQFNCQDLAREVQQKIVSSKMKFDAVQVSYILKMLEEYEVSDQFIFQKLVNRFLKSFDGEDMKLIGRVVFSLAVLKCPIQYVEEIINRIEWSQENRLPLSVLRKFKMAELLYQRQNQKLQIPQQEVRLSTESQRILRANDIREFLRPYVSQVDILYPILDGLCWIDVIVQFDNLQKLGIVILIEGDFIFNQSKSLTRQANERIQIVEHLGWKIVQVDWSQWKTNNNYKIEIVNKLNVLKS